MTDRGVINRLKYKDMGTIDHLSDDEIDRLLLLLFEDASVSVNLTTESLMAQKSDEELRRIRSKNHPDKWPEVDLDVYRVAVQELDRRRNRP